MTTTPQAVAAIYLRQSKDSTKSTTEQDVECRELCAEHGWSIGGVYRDGISASRFTRKERDGWSELLGQIRAGRFSVLVMWESSRGDRKLPEWAAFLDLCRDRALLIHVVSHGRTYDLRQSRDWKTLAEDGVSNAFASEETSVRLLRNARGLARKGHPYGRVPYGYMREYAVVKDPDTGKQVRLVEQVPDPETAPVVREIFRRIGRGDPINAIRKDLERRGVPASTGSRWWATTIRQLALRSAYVGKRDHKGELHDAAWPALVTDKQFARARRVLLGPDRRVGVKPGAVKYRLTRAAKCDVCGMPIGGRPRHPAGVFRYDCVDGHVSVRGDWLEAYVFGIVGERLSRDDAYAALAQVDDSVAQAALDEADQLRARLDEFRDEAAAGGLTAASLARVEARLLPQIEAADERAHAASVPAPLRELLEPGADIAARLDAMPASAQRDVVVFLLDLTILRPTTTARGSSMRPEHVPQRVHIAWRTNGGTSSEGCPCWRCTTAA